LEEYEERTKKLIEDDATVFSSSFEGESEKQDEGKADGDT